MIRINQHRYFSNTRRALDNMAETRSRISRLSDRSPRHVNRRQRP